MRTLPLDRQLSDLEIRKLDLALDVTLPVRLRGHQIGTVREMDWLIPSVQPEVGGAGVQLDREVYERSGTRKLSS